MILQLLVNMGIKVGIQMLTKHVCLPNDDYDYVDKKKQDEEEG